MTPSPASPPPPPQRPASRRTGVDDCPHGLGDAAPQSGVEQLDNEDEAGAEHEQGGGQQDEAHGQVRERCARKHHRNRGAKQPQDMERAELILKLQVTINSSGLALSHKEKN